MFDIDSDRFIKPAEEGTKKFLDAMEWDKIAEELTRWSRSASALSEAMSPIVTEVREAKEEIEMEKSEKDTEALVDNLANYKDSYIPAVDDMRSISVQYSIRFDDGATTMLVPVGEVIDKLIDFLIN